ncbi:MAG: ATP-dependent endonuclease [Rhodospirillaceae bacterium]|nr:MAG: ATP-dependent endonuclease [Rhodospirillaceae bacterium]
MKLRFLRIKNFRGVQDGKIFLDGHSVLIGGNSVGKSTVCEAMDLLLGPDRINRSSAIDEHDFFGRRYLDEDGNPTAIEIEGILTDMTGDIERQYRGHLEHWNTNSRSLLDETATPEDIASDGVIPALRVSFCGCYDQEEDEFRAETFFSSPPVEEGGQHARFGRVDKRQFGFLYLRTSRTGARALSLERGSLLDIILRLKDNDRTQMWEHTLKSIENIKPPIHEIKQLKEVLDEVDVRIRQFVGLSKNDPALGLFPSQLTRDALRKTVTLFGASERSETLVPYWRLGSGVVNAMVFSLLTFIADLKDNVIFAMEEPELAIPPHTQRRIVKFLQKSMNQAILTTHSPFVLEQFPPESVIILDRNEDKELIGKPLELSGLKAKNYRGGIRHRYAEAMLGRGVICVEGVSDEEVLKAVSYILEEECTEDAPYTPLDLSGVTVVSVDGDGNLPQLGRFFAGIGLKTYALFDEQKNANQADEIHGVYDRAWELNYSGIEKFLANEISIDRLRDFLDDAQDWEDYPIKNFKYEDKMNDDDVIKLSWKLLKVRKGSAYAERLIEEFCYMKDLPDLLCDALTQVSDDLSAKPFAIVAGDDEGEE